MFSEDNEKYRLAWRLVRIVMARTAHYPTGIAYLD